MAVNTLTGDTVVYGNLRADTMTLSDSCVVNSSVAATADIARSKLAQDALAEHVVPWSSFRVFDAYNTNLPATSGSDDLGLYAGTHGSDAPAIETGDVKASTITRNARFSFALPPWYDAQQTIYIRAYAGMITTIASATATLDFACFKTDHKGAVSGSDLCTTAAQSINSVTFANKDFVITPTGLAAGDVFDILMTVYVEDAATGTPVIASIGKVSMMLDIRG